MRKYMKSSFDVQIWKYADVQMRVSVRMCRYADGCIAHLHICTFAHYFGML